MSNTTTSRAKPCIWALEVCIRGEWHAAQEFSTYTLAFDAKARREVNAEGMALIGWTGVRIRCVACSPETLAVTEAQDAFDAAGGKWLR